MFYFLGPQEFYEVITIKNSTVTRCSIFMHSILHSSATELLTLYITSFELEWLV